MIETNSESDYTFMLSVKLSSLSIFSVDVTSLNFFARFLVPAAFSFWQQRIFMVQIDNKYDK